jgi:G3E family GTPase
VLRHKFEAGAVITTVDAVHGAEQLARHPECRKQVGVADRLILTKTDLAEPPAASQIAAALRRMNPAAQIIDFPADAALAQLLDGKWHAALPSQASASAHGVSSGHAQAHNHDADHTPDVDSVSIILDRPVEWSAFAVWLTLLLHAHGDKVLRFKALLDVEGWAAPVVLDAVHHLVHPPIHLSAWPAGPHTSRLVFIAQGLRMDLIQPSLEAFLADANAERRETVAAG